MLKQFLSSIGYGSMKVETIIGSPAIAFGENLNGTVYIDGGDSEQLVDYIEIELIKRTTEEREDSDFNTHDKFITKQSLEMVSTVKSKETHMIPFELVPDERWETQSDKEKLILRTTVYIMNAVDVHDEDEITYG